MSSISPCLSLLGIVSSGWLVLLVNAELNGAAVRNRTRPIPRPSLTGRQISCDQCQTLSLFVCSPIDLAKGHFPLLLCATI
ncbi:hypothetical protein V8C44DRAFT_307955 [Trichoderma aethiopicum]